jgi:sec-independent protein translocase protein TatC
VRRRFAAPRLGHGEAAPLVDHLGELRHRVLIALGALAPAFAVAFAFHTTLIEWLTAPLPDDVQLVTLGVTEPFTTAVKISLLAGFALALPIVLYQLWAFLAPAVEQRLHRTLSGLVVVATGLFLAGVAFGYFVVLPRAITFLVTFDESLYDIQVRAGYYLGFAAMLLLAGGIVFELPVFILALVRLRVLSSDTLRRNRRIGYVAMFVLAVALPSVDPVSLLFESLPLIALFEGSIWLSVAFERRWERRADALAGAST